MGANQGDEAGVLRAEHRALRAAMKALEFELGEEGGGTLTGSPRPEILRGFRDEVAAHFRLEESGGLLGDADRHDPGTARRVRELVAEHAAILASLDELVARLDAEQDGHSAAEVGAVLDALRAHESAETELFQSRVYRETGRGD